MASDPYTAEERAASPIDGGAVTCTTCGDEVPSTYHGRCRDCVTDAPRICSNCHAITSAMEDGRCVPCEAFYNAIHDYGKAMEDPEDLDDDYDTDTDVVNDIMAYAIGLLDRPHDDCPNHGGRNV